MGRLDPGTASGCAAPYGMDGAAAATHDSGWGFAVGAQHCERGFVATRFHSVVLSGALYWFLRSGWDADRTSTLADTLRCRLGALGGNTETGFGSAIGWLLHQRAHGTDPRTVAPGRPAGVLRATRRFEHDVLDPDQVRQALLALADDLGARGRARRQERPRGGAADHLRGPHHDDPLPDPARTDCAHSRPPGDPLAVFGALRLQRARIRAVTARVGALLAAERAFVQLTLDAMTEDRRVLEPVIDKAARRWGSGTVHPAALTRPKTRPTGAARHRAAP